MVEVLLVAGAAELAQLEIREGMELLVVMAATPTFKVQPQGIR